MSMVVACRSGPLVLALVNLWVLASQAEQKLSALDLAKRILQVDGREAEITSTAVAEPEPLRVIGASLSRTGTVSLKEALEQVGYKVYHGGDVFVGDYPKLWADVALEEESSSSSGSPQRAALDRLITKISTDGFNATLDCPACALYGEFLARYPSAKVVLTVRDRADDWAASALSTAFQFSKYFRMRPFTWLQSINNVALQMRWLMIRRFSLPEHEFFEDGLPDTGEITTRAAAAAVYERYVEQVKAHVPSDRLLEFNVKEGWRPLCHFLLSSTDECPDDRKQPFPRVNDRSTIMASIRACQVIVWIWPLLALLPLFCAWRICRCICGCSRLLPARRKVE